MPKGEDCGRNATIWRVARWLSNGNETLEVGRSIRPPPIFQFNNRKAFIMSDFSWLQEEHRRAVVVVHFDWLFSEEVRPFFDGAVIARAEFKLWSNCMEYDCYHRDLPRSNSACENPVMIPYLDASGKLSFMKEPEFFEPEQVEGFVYLSKRKQ